MVIYNSLLGQGKTYKLYPVFRPVAGGIGSSLRVRFLV